MTDANYLMYKATSNGGQHMPSLHKLKLHRKKVNQVLQLYPLDDVSQIIHYDILVLAICEHRAGLFVLILRKVIVCHLPFILVVMCAFSSFVYFCCQARKGDGRMRNIPELLNFLYKIPNIKRSVDQLPVKENGRRTLEIRFAGDGRRTSKRLGSVMSVISLLCEKESNASREYTVNLYNGRSLSCCRCWSCSCCY